MMDRISTCEALAKRNEIDPFLKWMVIGDQKWVTYDNTVRKRSWSKGSEDAQAMAKPGLTARKVLLCIWKDWKEIIYCELLPYGQTLNSDLYCQQLNRLKLVIDQKRPELANRRGIVFHQDSSETLRTWLESFNASTVYSGPGTKGLPPFSLISKLPEW
ncbi:mariner Mos1 transposase [Trichonephila clavipes]|nr:mariner Mos1 transposase [Trichonephila clavipes]